MKLSISNTFLIKNHLAIIIIVICKNSFIRNTYQDKKYTLLKVFNILTIFVSPFLALY